MKVNVYVVNEVVDTIECPLFEPYSDVSSDCKFSVPPCEHVPKYLFEKWRRVLDFHQAYGFLCVCARRKRK
jgi:hypothetical protein